MDEELDLIVFEDDQGNQLTMQVMDYLFYEGKEYALISEYREDENDDSDRESLVMEVHPLEDDEDNEEFLPIDDALGERLLQLFATQYDEEDDYPEDPEEE